MKDIFGHIGEFIVGFFTAIGEIIISSLGHWTTWFILAFIMVGLGALANLSFGGLSAASIWQAIWSVIAGLWWLWVFLIFWPILHDTWLHSRQEHYKKNTKWVLLELRIPREVKEMPMAMEQVLLALHGLRNAPDNVKEKYWDGEVTRWFSLEMVSIGGEVHFYIRLYARQKDLVMAAFYSYYRDIEIEEVEDYVNKFPASVGELYAKNYDMWATEMVLAKDDAYPIKTYPHFLESAEEEKRVDPISTFLEVLSKLKKEEMVGIQILIAPAPPNWRDEWQDLVEKLKIPAGKKQAKEGEKESLRASFLRTPGETDILKAVENNLSKRAFDTLVRFIYISPKNSFYDSFARRGLTGAFNQYSALDLNSFRSNYTMATRTQFWHWPHLFPTARNQYRKQRMLRLYRERDVPHETWVGKLLDSYFLNWGFASKRFQMNIEGLATLFHPPTVMVLTAPHIRRVESRKGGPPAGLAIFGEEETIEKFMNKDKDKS